VLTCTASHALPRKPQWLFPTATGTRVLGVEDNTDLPIRLRDYCR